MHDFYQHTIFPFEDIAKECKFDTSLDNTYDFRYYKYSKDNRDELVIESAANKFTFNLKLNNLRNNIKSLIIICSKDNSNILDYTLRKLKEFHTFEDHDVLLVDDRSATNDIFDLATKYNLSYLRINNEFDIFNYSILNNIASAYAKFFDKELLIFHNNDMWPSHKDTLSNIIDKHTMYNSNLTGCRLIYPTKQAYEDLGKPTHLLDSKLDKLYNTIQHGGIFFYPRESYVFKNKSKHPSHIYSPSHLFRFYEKDYFSACLDTACYSVTGALHVIRTQDFIDLGGLNICLATAFQDIDLCVKALSKNMSVYYIGSEYMYHAESLTNAKENLTEKPEFIYDHIVWDILWTKALPYLLGINHTNKAYI